VADASAAEQLVAIAQANAAVFITLVAPPGAPTVHQLEIRAPGRAPIVVLAEPLGAPTGDGCLLRLRTALPEVPVLESEPNLPASLPDLELGPSTRPPHDAERATPSAPETDWLETGSAVSSVPMPASGSHASAIDLAGAPPSHDERALAPFLRRLAETTDPRAFAALLAPLEPQIRSLLHDGHTTAAWRLCSTLQIVAGDPPGPRSRAPLAAKILEVFRDPKILEPLAEVVLDGRETADGAAARLVVRAGKRGARALYQARLKRGTPEARTRFVALVEAIGAPAVPVFEVALPLLEGRLAVPGAVEIVEDLLMSLPNVHHPKLGVLVTHYAQSNHPTLAPLAARVATRIA
jgi:hypothetical protein